MTLDIPFLEDRICKQMQDSRVPGLALGIFSSGDLVYAHGFGVTSVEEGRPVTSQTLFRIGSTTKALTATVAMRLVEAGLLDLNQSIYRYIPDLHFNQPGIEHIITLRLLLSHTAGLPTLSDPHGRRDPAALGEMLHHRLPTIPLKAPPGKIGSYSNLGMHLVGYLIEKVTGEPYPAAVQRWLFEPLGMARTTFDPLVAMTYPLAQSHTLTADGELVVDHRFAENTAEYPAGFCISTIDDMVRFAQLHLQKGTFQGRELLSPASVAEMQREQVSLYTLSEAGYGLAFHLDRYQGVRRVFHHGGLMGFGSRFCLLPDHGAAVLMFYNRSYQFAAQADGIVNGIVDRLLGLPDAPLPTVSISDDPARWQPLIGSYLSNFTGLAEIRANPDHLELVLNGVDLRLDRVSAQVYAGTFESGRKISVGFVPEDDGPVQYAVIQGTACRRIERDQLVPPDPGRWEAWAGEYQGEFGRVQVDFRAGQLHLFSVERGQTVTALPLDINRFTCAWGLIQFLENQPAGWQLKIANYHPSNRSV